MFPRKTRTHRLPAANLLTILASAVLAILLSRPGWAASSPRDTSLTADPDSVFSALADAWRHGREKEMAAWIHPDGLRVTFGGDYDQFEIFEPKQAIPFLKKLFVEHPTVEFQFRRLPDSHDGTQCFGMVVWKFRLPGHSLPSEQKYVMVLKEMDNQWRLSELNSLAQR